MTAHILVLSDIFGLCKGLERLLAALNQAGAAVQVIDPYQGTPQQFADEAEAYAGYSAQCGHEAYATIAVQAVQRSEPPFALALGFSAGATALWRALAGADSRRLKQAILFYPGQIHQHIALQPAIPTQVIFGNGEPHFNVAAICQQLQQQGVTAVSSGYQHGFMNPASGAFDEAAYQQQLKKLKSLVG